MSQSPARTGHDRIAPALLLALCVVPTLAGMARLSGLAMGEVRPDAARFAAGWAPLVVHILSACAYGVLGAFQFSPAIRRRWPRAHRAAGRFLVAAGLAAALSALWLTLAYPPGARDGDLLLSLRLVFGGAMILSLLLGVDAIRRGDLSGHRAWMMRGYAIGMGAGTQGAILLPWTLLAGEAGETARALLMGAGWTLNLLIAETLIRRDRPTALAAARHAAV